MALRVLLADESSTIRKVIQLALQDFGVEVKSVPIGVDVIPVAKSFHPDIVFADVLLAKRNGYEVCGDIKGDPELRNIPVILMWSGFMEIDEAKARAAKPDRRLEKPFDAETLRRLVRDLVPTTQGNVIANYLTFPELPDIVGDSKRPTAKPNTTPTQRPSAFSSSGVVPDRPVTPPARNQIRPKPTEPITKSTIGDFDEPEEFQQVPLPKNKRAPVEVESDEAWAHKDLNKFKVELPPEDNFSLDIDEGELTRTSIALSDGFEEIELGDIDNPEPISKRKKSSLSERISEKSNTFGSGVRSDVAMQGNPLYVDTARAEEILREEARAIVKEIAWQMMPAICERVVREELQKLLKDSERL